MPFQSPRKHQVRTSWQTLRAGKERVSCVSSSSRRAQSSHADGIMPLASARMRSSAGVKLWKIVGGRGLSAITR